MPRPLTNPRGVVLDYIQFTGGAYGYTFTNATYYVSGSATVGGGGAIFQAGACLKFASNACLWVQGGSVSFPSSGAQVVFTSKDDNSYGDWITNSTSVPSYAASPGLSVYWPSAYTPCSVQNARFRWAYTGVAYSDNATLSPTVSSSVFEDCQCGVDIWLPGSTVTFSSDTYCNVATPIRLEQGTVSGSVTADCGTAVTNPPVDASRLSGIEGEPAITVNPVNPQNLFIDANGPDGVVDWSPWTAGQPGRTVIRFI